MGKATIISEQGEGLYTIQPEWNTTVATARIAALTAENTAIDTRLGTIDTEIASAEFDYNYATDVLNAAIINQAPEAEIETKQRDVLTKRAEWQGLKQTKSFLQLRKTANTKQIEFIEEMTAAPAQVQAWCADYTEGATGVVGTIELGRRDTTPIIRPGGTEGTAAAYTALTDGQLVPLMSGSPSATFVNYALLPGAAKWKARYRTGTASNIDTATDTMDVALDALTIAGIACNQASSLTAVPVEYMTCNAEAFENGDNVIVEFSMNWATPKVVGFSAGPKPCDLAELWLARWHISSTVYIDKVDLSTDAQTNEFSVTTGETTYVGMEIYSKKLYEVAPTTPRAIIVDLETGTTIYSAAPVTVDSGFTYEGFTANSTREFLATASNAYEVPSVIYGLNPADHTQVWSTSLIGATKISAISANEYGAVVTTYPADGVERAKVFILNNDGTILKNDNIQPANNQGFGGSTRATKDLFYAICFTDADGYHLRRYDRFGVFDGIAGVSIPNFNYDYSPAMDETKLVLLQSQNAIASLSQPEVRRMHVYTRSVTRDEDDGFVSETFTFVKTIDLYKNGAGPSGWPSGNPNYRGASFG